MIRRLACTIGIAVLAGWGGYLLAHHTFGVTTPEAWSIGGAATVIGWFLGLAIVGAWYQRDKE